MELNLLYELYKDEKMHKYLKLNSEWYKYLNRNPNNYDIFKKSIKKQYRLNPTDKMSNILKTLE